MCWHKCLLVVGFVFFCSRTRSRFLGIQVGWGAAQLAIYRQVLATAVLLVGLCRRNHDDLIGAIAFIRNVDRVVGALPQSGPPDFHDGC